MVDTGDTLGERYRLLRLVGAGGTGAVYEAHDEELDRRVAIKITNKEILEDAVALARFEREPRFVGRLGHRNIIDIHDVGALPEGQRFIVMEYLEGESLGVRLAREGEADISTALYVIAQVLSALDAAHRKKIIHRDLKPDNIFLVNSGRELPDIKVLDFGMSKSIDGSLAKSKLTDLGVVVGTPYYMAPEQFEDVGEIDKRVDIYSAGVILYEMLTGTLPFTASSLSGLVNKVLNTEALPPRELRSAVPVGVEEIVLRALARRREQRFRSAVAMLHATLPYIDDDVRERIALPDEVRTAAASDDEGESPVGDDTSSRGDGPELSGRLVEDREVSGPSDRDPMIGRTVAGKFSIVERIKSGGMGTVYEAVQQPIGRTVALKILRKDLAQNPLIVERFKREARVVSLLKSDHSITLFDFGHDEGDTLYLAMEFVRGTTLKGHILEHGPLPWRVALELGAQIAEALLEAHEKGVVHRDLKSDNILLSSDRKGKESAKVVDFGIARLTQTEGGEGSDITHTGTIFGTPGYMSPEQAQGLKVDHRTDIYSLGVVLFEMLAGKPPYEANAAVLLMGKHIVSRVPTIASRAANADVVIPRDVERLIHWMMAKEPEERPDSLAEVLEIIGGLLADEAVELPDAPESLPSDDEPPSAEQAQEEPTAPDMTLLPKRGARRSSWKVLVPAIVVVAVGAFGFMAITRPGADEPAGAAMAIVGRHGDAALGPHSKTSSPDAGRLDASVDEQAETGADVGLDDGDSLAPASSRAEVTVSVLPREAAIFIEGNEVEGNPYRGVFKRDGTILRIEASARGYRRQTKLVKLDGDRQVEIELQRASGEKTARPGTPSATPTKMLIEVNPY